MNTDKKNPELLAKEKLVRYLKSKAYPVVPLSGIIQRSKKEKKTAKDLFIDQVKKSLNGPCIFMHFPGEQDSAEE